MRTAEETLLPTDNQVKEKTGGSIENQSNQPNKHSSTKGSKKLPHSTKDYGT